MQEEYKTYMMYRIIKQLMNLTMIRVLGPGRILISIPTPTPFLGPFLHNNHYGLPPVEASL